MEIELKLLIDPGDIASLRSSPLLARHAIAKPRVQLLNTTYFDTPELFFRMHGAALRVRRVDRHWVQTLKAGGQVTAGLHSRHEWESRTGGSRPDLNALRDMDGMDSEWRGLLSDATLAERLVPVFNSRFRRTIWLLRLDSGADVELALDRGAIEHDAASVPVSEVELELKSGDPAKLFEFALEIQATIPLRVSNVSKAERGFTLHAPVTPVVLKAAPVLLPPRTSVEEGLRAIAGNCLHQIQGNEDGVVQGRDAESVHQMRVGVRRLRLALRMFGQVAPPPATLNAELKWLAEELGAARDWEVLAGSTLPDIEKACPAETGLAKLRGAAERLAEENRTRAAGAVRSARYSRLLLSLGHWMQSARAGESLPPAQQVALAAPLAGFAARILKRWHARLLKQGPTLPEATPESRHQVRIVAKRIRYAADFFVSLYPARQMRPYVKTLTGLQDELGQLNDGAVAAGLLGRLVQADAGLEQSASFVSGFLSSSAQRGLRRLNRRWKKFGRIGRPPGK